MKTLLALLLTPALTLAQAWAGMSFEAAFMAGYKKGLLERPMADVAVCGDAYQKPATCSDQEIADRLIQSEPLRDLVIANIKSRGLVKGTRYISPAIRAEVQAEMIQEQTSRPVAPMFDFPRDNYLHSEVEKNYAVTNFLNRH